MRDVMAVQEVLFPIRTAALLRIVAITCSVLFAPSVLMAQTDFTFFEPVQPPRPIQVMVHRGMAIAAPENSARAIEMCIEDYCEWVEIDIRLTKDGQHVLIHNETLDSTTNGKGRVSDFTLAELQQLDAGSWFGERFAHTRLLSLPEALSLAKGKINYYLDCKQVDLQRLVEEVVAAGMERQVIVYEAPENLTRLRQFSKSAIAGMTKYRPNMPLDAFIKEVAPAAVEIDASDLTPELAQKFHDAGIKVQAKVLGDRWDNPQTWASVIGAGADWLQTDEPAGVLFLSAHRRTGKFPVMIACHRGASRYAPENTIPAIRLAAQMNVDFAEIDIRTTQDGQTVLMHDGSVNRTTPAKGNVRDLRYDDLLATSAGRWFGKPYFETKVPSFAAGLTEFGDKLGAYLDAKEIAPEAIAAAIERHHLGERHVVYQSLEYCEKLKKLNPDIRIMPPLKRLTDLEKVAAIRPYAVDAAWSSLSKELIGQCHERGIKVFSDALGPHETVEQYRKAIDWGIDCIQTDHPLRVMRAVELSQSKA